MPKPYPSEFRDDVVRVAQNREPGVTIEQIAKDFGVHPMTLQKWMRRADIDSGAKPGQSRTEAAERYLQRMKRIEGLARGIANMIDEEQYCIHILTQVSALTRSLQGVATGLLDDHLKHCMLDAAKVRDEAAHEKIQESTAAVNRLIRS